MYGVDQCRVCGIPIPHTGPEAVRKQEEANRRPIIPEKEWRRRGFLTSPTRSQLGLAGARGCCAQCGLKVMKQQFKYSTRFFLVLALGVTTAAVMVYVSTYLPH